MPFVFYFYFLRRERFMRVFTGTGSSALTLQAVLRRAGWRVEWRPERDVDAENSAGVDVTLTSSQVGDASRHGRGPRPGGRRTRARGKQQRTHALYVHACYTYRRRTHGTAGPSPIAHLPLRLRVTASVCVSGLQTPRRLPYYAIYH